MALIPILQGLHVPTRQIMRQANHDINTALKIAAAYGYGCACRDHDQVSTSSLTQPKQ